jgi:hypothetical protein
VLNKLLFSVVSLLISTNALSQESYVRIKLYEKRPVNSFKLIDSDKEVVCNKYLSAINEERDFIKRNEFSLQAPRPKSQMDLPELLIQTDLNSPRQIIPNKLLGLGGDSRYEQFTITTSDTAKPFYAIRSTGSRGGGWIHLLSMYPELLISSPQEQPNREFLDKTRDHKFVNIDWNKVGTNRPLDLAARDIGVNSLARGGVVEIIKIEGKDYLVRTSAYITYNKLIDIVLFKIDKSLEATPLCFLQSNFVVTK